LQKQQLALQQEGLQFAKDRYNDANMLYKPIQQKVVDSAMEGVKADLGGVSSRAAADVAQQYSGLGAALQRNQARMGINPNSGQAMSQARLTGLSQALATAGGVTRAREAERTNAEDKTFQRQFAVGQMGVNQINGTASAVTSATNNMADAYGSMANSASQGANAMLGAGGYLITQGLNGKLGMNTTNTGVTADSLNIQQPTLGGMGVQTYPPLISSPATFNLTGE
jgi:hypothetical protein